MHTQHSKWIPYSLGMSLQTPKRLSYNRYLSTGKIPATLAVLISSNDFNKLHMMFTWWRRVSHVFSELHTRSLHVVLALARLVMKTNYLEMGGIFRGFILGSWLNPFNPLARGRVLIGAVWHETPGWCMLGNVLEWCPFIAMTLLSQYFSNHNDSCFCVLYLGHNRIEARAYFGRQSMI